MEKPMTETKKRILPNVKVDKATESSVKIPKLDNAADRMRRLVQEHEEELEKEKKKEEFERDQRTVELFPRVLEEIAKYAKDGKEDVLLRRLNNAYQSKEYNEAILIELLKKEGFKIEEEQDLSYGGRRKDMQVSWARKK
jgi:hypothetical protein